jgi:hypothetical protein
MPEPCAPNQWPLNGKIEAVHSELKTTAARLLPMLITSPTYLGTLGRTDTLSETTSISRNEEDKQQIHLIAMIISAHTTGHRRGLLTTESRNMFALAMGRDGCFEMSAAGPNGVGNGETGAIP